MVEINNENCFDTIKKLKEKETKIDVILTSPFYNTNKKAGAKRTLQNISSEGYAYVRYDTHIDKMTNDEYCAFTAELFNEFNSILKQNGVILYNLNYGCDNTEGLFRAINSIIVDTPFTIGDVISWKKKNAMPNNCSPNKLTRIWEFVFVICRKDELATYYCNKRIKGYRKTGQASYENIFNIVYADNNDEACPYNKATFSSEFCTKLLKLYAPNNALVYDPFIGTGTTAVACVKLGHDCIGSELSEKQCSWAKERISKIALK